MDNSPITNNTVVNLSDTPQTHQTATLKANEENTNGANSGVVNAMKDNVSSYNEYQLRNIGVPQSELNKVPESAKKSW